MSESGTQYTESTQSVGNMETDCERVARAKKTRARAYVFTWFGASTQEIEEFEKEAKKMPFEYIMGDETCPTTGEQHWQGYIRFNYAAMKATVDKLVNGRYVAIAEGKPWSQWNYCTKEKGEIKTNIKWEKYIPSDEKELIRMRDEIVMSTSDYMMVYCKQFNEPNNFDILGFEPNNDEQTINMGKFTALEFKGMILRSTEDAYQIIINDKNKWEKKNRKSCVEWEPKPIIFIKLKGSKDLDKEIIRNIQNGLLYSKKETVITQRIKIYIFETVERTNDTVIPKYASKYSFD